MIQKIYTVFDSKAEAYLQPYYAKNDSVAIRLFRVAANDKEHQFSISAEDYTLFRIGEFDVNNGTITTELPTVIARAHELKGN